MSDDQPRDEQGRFAGLGAWAGKGAANANARPTWNALPGGGYQHSNGATLTKQGKGWVLKTKDGKEHAMPKKATFDHAESLM